MANNNSKRGLASADEETRHRVAQAGGEARADDPDIRSGEVGRKGGEAVKKKYGRGFYQEIGKKGGQSRSEESGGGGNQSMGEDDED